MIGTDEAVAFREKLQNTACADTGDQSLGVGRVFVFFCDLGNADTAIAAADARRFTVFLFLAATGREFLVIPVVVVITGAVIIRLGGRFSSLQAFRRNGHLTIALYLMGSGKGVGLERALLLQLRLRAGCIRTGKRRC